MPARERLTIDATVARDYLEPDRERHRQARKLFELAQRGEVELAAATSGYVFDIEGELAEQMRAAFASEGVASTPQLAYPDVMYPGENAYPDAAVDGLGGAWHAALDDWKSHEAAEPGPNDRLHIETHVLTERDVFITDDGPLLVMCRRLAEHGFEVRAMRLAEYLESRR